MALNKSETKRIKMGMNPKRDFAHEYRIYNMATLTYFRVTMVELEKFFEIYLQIGEESPFRISRSLFVTKKKNGIYCLEREAKLLDNSMKSLYMAKVSFDSLQEVLQICKYTEELIPSEVAQNQLQSFMLTIGHQFNFKVPTEAELLLWYAEYQKMNPNESFHNVEFDLILNYKNFLLQSMYKFFCVFVEDNKYMPEIIF